MGQHRRLWRKPLVDRVNKPAGFTLVELVVVIIVLGIVSAVAIPRMGLLGDSAKVNATKDEMSRLKTAIVGAANYKGVPRGGFEIDVGHAPNSLADLITKPDSVAIWNKFLSLGWNGPYMDSSGGDYLTDSWDSTYQYNAATRTITSAGNGTPITISF